MKRNYKDIKPKAPNQPSFSPRVRERSNVESSYSSDVSCDNLFYAPTNNSHHASSIAATNDDISVNGSEVSIRVPTQFARDGEHSEGNHQTDDNNECIDVDTNDREAFSSPIQPLDESLEPNEPVMNHRSTLQEDEGLLYDGNGNLENPGDSQESNKINDSKELRRLTNDGAESLNLGDKYDQLPNNPINQEKLAKERKCLWSLAAVTLGMLVILNLLLLVLTCDYAREMKEGFFDHSKDKMPEITEMEHKLLESLSLHPSKKNFKDQHTAQCCSCKKGCASDWGLVLGGLVAGVVAIPGIVLYFVCCSGTDTSTVNCDTNDGATNRQIGLCTCNNTGVKEYLVKQCTLLHSFGGFYICARDHPDTIWVPQKSDLDNPINVGKGKLTLKDAFNHAVKLFAIYLIGVEDSKRQRVLNLLGCNTVFVVAIGSEDQNVVNSEIQKVNPGLDANSVFISQLQYWSRELVTRC